MPRRPVRLAICATLFALTLGCATAAPPARTPSVPAAPTASPAATPTSPGELDVVRAGMYYRQGWPITQGWNGLAWGDSIEKFIQRFPDARQVGANTTWTTGNAQEVFFGHTFLPTYHFDPQGRFIAVSLTKSNREQLVPLVNTMLQTLGTPKSKKVRWEFGDVVVYAVHHSVVIRSLSTP